MFTTLLSFCLIVFLKFPSKIEAHRDQSGSFSEHNGQILLTDSQTELTNFGSFHESREFAQRKVRRNSEKSAGEDCDHDSSSWHWGYRNINKWGKHFPHCSGKRQSPIDLNTHAMAHLDVPKPFVWNGYSTIPTSMTIVNNGHSVELSASWNGKNTPYLSGGVLKSDYVFHQLHFHWGPHNDVGSEHTLNKRSSPLEMHMVHYKKEYGSASEAMKHEDGLVVVGILFDKTKPKPAVTPFSKLPNGGIAAILKYTKKMKKPGCPIKIRPFPLSMFKLDFPEKYVVYLGSLTTPPCNEIVTWILPLDPRYVSQSQLDNFRKIILNGGDDHNYRPTMSLNDRKINYFTRD